MSSPESSSSTQWANVEQVRPSVVTAVSCFADVGRLRRAGGGGRERQADHAVVHLRPVRELVLRCVDLTEPGHQRPVAGGADHGQAVGPGGIARERLLGEPRHEHSVEPDDLVHRIAGGDDLGHEVGRLGVGRQHNPVGRRGGDRGGLVGERHSPGRIGQGGDLDPACRQLGGQRRGELVAVHVVSGHDHRRRRAAVPRRRRERARRRRSPRGGRRAVRCARTTAIGAALRE